MAIQMKTNKLSTKSLFKYQIGDLKGVDFTNSRLKVNPKRAVLSKNIIKRNGTNQKRFGWKEVKHFFRVDNEGNIIQDKINGIYKLGNKTIIQVGTRFLYTTDELDNENALYIEIDSSLINTDRIIDDKSYGIVSKDKLYILCGDYLVYDGEYLKRVIDENTYIPTTTIAISPEGVTNHQTSYEDVNLLNKYRKNELSVISEDLFLANNLTELRYYLDTTVVGAETDYFKITITYVEQTELVAGGEDGNPVYKYESKDIVLTQEIGSSSSNIIQFDTGESHWPVKTTATVNKDVNGRALLVLHFWKIREHWPRPHIVYYDEDRHPIDIFLDQIKSIVVEFPHAVEGYADKISKCRFGTLFGYKRNDRLFVSGNPDYPNMDWYSAEEDLTYFPDLNYTVFGTDNSKVMGYSIISDNVMAVFKSHSTQEPTIYYRSINLANVTDDRGNYIYRQDGGTYTTEVFPVQVGSIGESLVSRFTLANVNEDILMLSKDGVYGVVVSNNLSKEQRYAKPRSRLINNEFLYSSKDLSKATSTVYRNMYYLALNDEIGSCYVADTASVFRLEDDLLDTYQYEWYYLDHIPARLFYQNGLDNKLYFGTDKGQICVFYDNENQPFADTQTILCPEGTLDVDLDTNTVTFTNEFKPYFEKLGEEDYIDIETSYNEEYKLLEKLLGEEDIVSISEEDETNTTLEISPNKFAFKIRYLNGIDCYVSGAGDTVYVLEVNIHDFKIRLKNKETSEYLVFAEKPNAIYIPLQKSKIVNVDIENNTFQLLDYIEVELNEDNTKILDSTNIVKDLYIMGGETHTYFGILHLEDIVSAYWETPPTHLGNNGYTKNLNSIVTTYETVIGGEVEIGVITRDNMRNFEVEGVNVLDFDNLDFSNFTFETSEFAKSHVKRMKLKNFNYISVYFKSENNKNVAINDITLVYSLGKKIKGVR